MTQAPKPRPANPVNAAIRELEQICQEHQTRRASLAAAVDDERAKREIAEASLKDALAEVETLKNKVAELSKAASAKATEWKTTSDPCLMSEKV